MPEVFALCSGFLTGDLALLRSISLEPLDKFMFAPVGMDAMRCGMKHLYTSWCKAGFAYPQ